jgi:DNA polymerase V
MFGLVDANSFYCSVEEVFSPALRGKPLCSMSNNDGCVIARNFAAKTLGVRMGQPVHELKDLVRTKGLLLRSANFGLYGDMSARINAILRQACPRVEVYSIDESFIDLTPVRHRESFCFDLRERIRRWTGIPNCIGIGPTKTLAKLANKAAKAGAGVVDLACPDRRKSVLDAFPVGDVWGVGRKFGARLQEMGIATAGQLRDAPEGLLLERFGVVLARTQRELQGEPCAGIEVEEPDRKQIMVSRSFGERVEDHERVAQAVATFAVRACEKLRSRGLATSAVWVFAGTDAFRPELRQHHPSRSVPLLSATMDTSHVLSTVRLLMRGMLKKGCAYKRGGIALMDLARHGDVQADLFAPAMVGNEKLMATMDQINRRFGRGTMGVGATGWQVKPQWGMRQLQLSPHYTTRLSDVPRATC